MANTRPESSGRLGSGTLKRNTSGRSLEFENATWSRPAFLRGNREGKQPLGKSNWAVWWWLAPLIFVVAAIASLFWGINRIQNTIESNSAQILADAGIDGSGLEFDASYRNVEVTGALPAGVTAQQVESALESDDSSAFNVRNATVLATGASVAATELTPIQVNAVSDGESINLTGTVPSQDHADEIVAAAEGTGLDVTNNLTVSGLDAESDDPEAQVAAYGAVIGTLTAGSFTSADLSIGDDGPVTGRIDAADQSVAQGFESVVGEGVDVSAPAELGSLDVTADFDGDRIVLDGTVLTTEHSDTLESAAAEIVGAENVTNNLVVSGLDEAVDGADGRVDALAASIGTFDGLTSADAQMNDTDLTVNGEALDEASQGTARDALADAEDSGLRPGGDISLPDAPPVEEQIDLLQAELDSLQQEIRENVVFETNLNELSPEAQATLDKVVAAMNRYPLPVVEVGGHTDDRGSDELNNALSQSRADAVAAYVGANVDPGRLEAIGFGESQPVADNTTPEGQQENRRVEFIAKESF